MGEKEFIFDVDGTLYPIDGEAGKKFTDSRVYAQIKTNILGVLQGVYRLSVEDAGQKYLELRQQYNGNISLAVEAEKGLKRTDYFQQTWSLNVEDYLRFDAELRGTLLELGSRFVALSAAPACWVSQVLDYLNVADLFPTVMTAEDRLTKPDPLVFLAVAQLGGSQTTDWVSVGDQIHSDINPAKAVGMTTVLVGPSDARADHSIRTVHDLPELARANGWQ